MAIDEQECVEVVLKVTEPILKPVELKNIGFLQKQPTLIQCPACEEDAFSLVRLETVTRWQRFLAFTNWWKNSERRHDINHYCSRCGCYIGRYVAVGCTERCISRQARKKAAHDAMTLKTKPKDCAEHMQKARENLQAKRAQEKAAKAASKASTGNGNA